MQLLRNTAVQDKINGIKSKVDKAKDEINERVVPKINVIGGFPKVAEMISTVCLPVLHTASISPAASIFPAVRC